MIVLGVETSCDDTGAAVVIDGRLCSNTVITQTEHSLYGGVVPEVASRLHEQKILPAVRQSLEQANVSLDHLSGVAATVGPGLAGALMVGLNFAKGLAQAREIPLVCIDHMEGHLWANFLERPLQDDDCPFICLLVSGGHTHLWRVDRMGSYQLLGHTLDDAAGEAFDKGARMLGLGYPGGPALEEAAESGDPDFIAFPRPLAGSAGCDFSFSGLKTALYYQLRRMDPDSIATKRRDLAASYQQAVIDCLLDRLKQAVELTGLVRVCVAGGVASNSLLRKRLDEWAATGNLTVSFPPREFCTDNAAMIALAGYYRLMQGERSPLSSEIKPNLRMDQLATN